MNTKSVHCKETDSLRSAVLRPADKATQSNKMPPKGYSRNAVSWSQKRENRKVPGSKSVSKQPWDFIHKVAARACQMWNLIMSQRSGA